MCVCVYVCVRVRVWNRCIFLDIFMVRACLSVCVCVCGGGGAAK